MTLLLSSLRARHFARFDGDTSLSATVHVRVPQQVQEVWRFRLSLCKLPLFAFEVEEDRILQIMEQLTALMVFSVL